VLFTIDQNQDQPRQHIDPLQPDMFMDLGPMAPASGPADLSAMLLEMSGERSGGDFESIHGDTTSRHVASTTKFFPELDFMPGFAFDSPMPEPPNVFLPPQGSLASSAGDWHSYRNGASEWNTQ
jgi:hypothetical protein